jgi:hypothetical protein
MSNAAPALLSALALTAIAALPARVRPGLYKGPGPLIEREIGWSLPSCAIHGLTTGRAS